MCSSLCSTNWNINWAFQFVGCWQMCSIMDLLCCVLPAAGLPVFREHWPSEAYIFQIGPMVSVLAVLMSDTRTLLTSIHECTEQIRNETMQMPTCLASLCDGPFCCTQVRRDESPAWIHARNKRCYLFHVAHHPSRVPWRTLAGSSIIPCR